MELLEQLTSIPGVPGREHRIRKFIEQRTANLFDEIHTDTMGSLIGLRKPRNASGKPVKSSKNKSKRVMVAAHMDQIGFVVSHVDDKGYLRLQNVGGFDTRNLFARMVTVCPDLDDPSKDLPGVLNPSGKPVHMADAEERKKVPEIHEFFVDLGMEADEVKEKVHIGDMVVLKARFDIVGKTAVTQCMDNRVACWTAIRAVEKLEEEKTAHACEIAIAFTVQEEVGLRGARTAAYELNPDIGIGLDTTLCVDIPGVGDNMAVTNRGKGVGITHQDGSAIGNYDLVKQMIELAEKRKITYQRSVLSRGGTDTGAIQPARAGIKAMTLSIPTRYIHTVTEMVHQDDMYAARDLLAAFLETVK